MFNRKRQRIQVLEAMLVAERQRTEALRGMFHEAVRLYKQTSDELEDALERLNRERWRQATWPQATSTDDGIGGAPV